MQSKKIIFSLLLSLSFMSNMSYAKDLSSLQGDAYIDMQKNNIENILKRLQNQEIFSVGEIENELFKILDSKNKDDVQQILELIIDAKEIKNDVKLGIALRNYKNLSVTQRQIIKEMSKEIKFFNYILINRFDYAPELERDEIILNLLKSSPHYISIDLIMKTDNQEIIKNYINIVESTGKTYESIKLFIGLYDKLSQDSKDKLFESIIGKIYSYESYGESENFFRFLLEKYIDLPKKYKEKIIFIATSSVNLDILNSIADKDLLKNVPQNDRQTILDGLLNKIKIKLERSIVSNIDERVENDNLKYLRNLILNYQYFTDNKESLIKYFDNRDLYSFLGSLIINDYQNMDKKIISLLPKIIKSGVSEDKFISLIIENYKNLPIEITDLLNIYIDNPIMSEKLADAISNNYINNMPEKITNELIDKLSKNSRNDKGVIRAILNNYKNMPDNLKNIFHIFIKSGRALPEIFSSTLLNYDELPKNIIDTGLSLIDKIDTKSLCSSFNESFYNIPDNLRNQILNKLSKRKDVDGLCDYDTFLEYKEQINPEIWTKLFSKEPEDLDNYESSEQSSFNESDNQFEKLDLEGKINRLNLLINSKETVNKALLILIEKFDIFSQPQANILLEKVLKQPDINKLYLGYLLNDKFNKLTVQIREKIALSLYKEDNVSTFVYAALAEHFNEFPEENRNLMINELADEFRIRFFETENKENEKKMPMVFAVLSGGSINHEEKNLENKINKISQIIDDTGTYSNYYLLLALSKNYDKLSLENKKLIERLTQIEKIQERKRYILLMVIDQMPENIYSKLSENLLRNKEGRQYLFAYLTQNIKVDLLNTSENFGRENKMIMSSRQQKILKVITKDLLKNDEFSNQIGYLLSRYPIIPDQIKSIFPELLKDKNNLPILLNQINMTNSFNGLSEDLKNILVDEVSRTSQNNYDSIWFYASNYHKFLQKNKLDLEKLNKSDVRTFALSFIYNYKNFPEIERVNILKKLSIDKDNSIYASLVLKNNFNLIDSYLRNELVNTLLKTNKLNQIPITYLIIEKFITFPKDIQNKLIDFSKDKQFGKYVAKGLVYNYKKVFPADLTEIVNNLKSNTEAIPYLIEAVGKNYIYLPDSVSKSIFRYYEEPELRKIVLSTLVSGYYQGNNKDLLIEQYLKDKSTFWDAMVSISKDMDFYYNKISKYPEVIENIKKQVIIVNKYKSSSFKEELDISKIINNRNFSVNVVFYKNWNNMPENLKKEFGPILYDLLNDPILTEQSPDMEDRIRIYYGRLFTTFVNNIDNMPEPFRTKFILDIADSSATNFMALELINENKLERLPYDLALKLAIKNTDELKGMIIHNNVMKYITELKEEEKISIISDNFLKDDDIDYSEYNINNYPLYKGFVEL